MTTHAQKRLFDRHEAAATEDEYAVRQQQRLMRRFMLWGGPIIGGVYVDDLGVSKFVQYAVMSPDGGTAVSKFVQYDITGVPDGVSVSKVVQYDILGMSRESISKFVQYIVLDTVVIPPLVPAMVGYQLRSIPGIDIGNDETPNLNLLRRRFVSPDAYHAAPPGTPLQASGMFMM